MGKMEILLVKNIFKKFKLSATSSLKWINEMQHHVLTAARSAALRPLWESFWLNKSHPTFGIHERLMCTVK